MSQAIVQHGMLIGSGVTLAFCFVLATMSPRSLPETMPSEPIASSPVEPPTPSVDDPIVVGHLRGRVIVTGEIPEPKELHVDRDKRAFKLPILDPTLRVDPDSRGLADVVVWIDRLHKWPSSIPPRDHDEAEPRTVRLEIENGMYERQLSVTTVGDRFEIVNRDNVGHWSKMDTFYTPHYGTSISSDDRQTREITQGEPVPIRISCTVHPWMDCWVVMAAHPYVTVTDANGKFVIENLPPGDHRVTFWHQQAGYLQRETYRVDDSLESDLGVLSFSIEEFE